MFSVIANESVVRIFGRPNSVQRFSATQMLVNHKFRHIYASEEHVIALDNENNTWSWRYASRTWLRRGFNTYGQLGLGDRKSREIPTKIEEHKFFDIQCNYHCVTLDEEGYLWSWRHAVRVWLCGEWVHLER